MKNEISKLSIKHKQSNKSNLTNISKKHSLSQEDSKQIIQDEIELLMNIYVDNVNIVNTSSTEPIIIEKTAVNIPLNLLFLVKVKILPKNCPMKCWLLLIIKYFKHYPYVKPEIEFAKYNIHDSHIVSLKEETQALLNERENDKCESVLDICFKAQEIVDLNNNALNNNNKETKINNTINNINNNANCNNPDNTQFVFRSSLKNNSNNNSNTLNNNTLTDHYLLNYQEMKKFTGNNFDFTNKNSQDNFIDCDETVPILEKIKHLSLTKDISRFKDDFSIEEIIGRGGGGVVYKVRNKYDGLYYAIKKIKFNSKNFENAKKLIKEIMLLSRLHHNNIVRYYQAWIENWDLEEKFSSDDDVTVTASKSTTKKKLFEFGMISNTNDINKINNKQVKNISRIINMENSNIKNYKEDLDFPNNYNKNCEDSGDDDVMFIRNNNSKSSNKSKDINIIDVNNLNKNDIKLEDDKIEYINSNNNKDIDYTMDVRKRSYSFHDTIKMNINSNTLSKTKSHVVNNQLEYNNNNTKANSSNNNINYKFNLNNEVNYFFNKPSYNRTNSNINNNSLSSNNSEENLFFNQNYYEDWNKDYEISNNVEKSSISGNIKRKEISKHYTQLDPGLNIWEDSDEHEVESDLENNNSSIKDKNINKTDYNFNNISKFTKHSNNNVNTGDDNNEVDKINYEENIIDKNSSNHESSVNINDNNTNIENIGINIWEDSLSMNDNNNTKNTNIINTNKTHNNIIQNNNIWDDSNEDISISQNNQSKNNSIITSPIIKFRSSNTKLSLQNEPDKLEASDNNTINSRNNNNSITDNSYILFNSKNNNQLNNLNNDSIINEEINNQKLLKAPITYINNDIKNTPPNKTNLTQAKNKSHFYKSLYIQMEFCEHKTVKEITDNKLATDDKSKWKIIIQIIEALIYIHSRKIVHRDLKPSNVFLDQNLNVKIGDFGLATSLKQNKNLIKNTTIRHTEHIMLSDGNYLSCGVGTLHYASPEQEYNNIYDEKTDMYALGIIIFEMFYTFYSYMEREVVLRNMFLKHEFPRDINEKISNNNIIIICKNLTSKDPKERMSAKTLANCSLLPSNFNQKIIMDNFNKIINDNDNLIPELVKILVGHCYNKSNISNSDNNFKTSPNLISSTPLLKQKSKQEEIFNAINNKIVKVLEKYNYNNTITLPYLLKGNFKYKVFSLLTISSFCDKYLNNQKPISVLNNINSIKIKKRNSQEPSTQNRNKKIAHESQTPINISNYEHEYFTYLSSFHDSEYILVLKEIDFVDSFNTSSNNNSTIASNSNTGNNNNNYYNSTNNFINKVLILNSKGELVSFYKAIYLIGKYIKDNDIDYGKFFTYSLNDIDYIKQTSNEDQKLNINTINNANNTNNKSSKFTKQSANLNKYINNHNLIFTITWSNVIRKTKIKLNSDISYHTEFLNLLLDITNLLPENNPIYIRFNTSFLIDHIFERLLVNEETKYLIITEIINCHFNNKSFKEENFTRLGISKLKYKELISSFRKFSGDIKTIKNKFDKNSFIFERLIFLESLIDSIDKRLKLNNINLTIDASLIPSLEFYSGFSFSVNYVFNGKGYLIMYGGRIDSYVSSVDEKCSCGSLQEDTSNVTDTSNEINKEDGYTWNDNNKNNNDYDNCNIEKNKDNMEKGIKANQINCSNGKDLININNKENNNNLEKDNDRTAKFKGSLNKLCDACSKFKSKVSSQSPLIGDIIPDYKITTSNDTHIYTANNNKLNTYKNFNSSNNKSAVNINESMTYKNTINLMKAESYNKSKYYRKTLSGVVYMEKITKLINNFYDYNPLEEELDYNLFVLFKSEVSIFWSQIVSSLFSNESNLSLGSLSIKHFAYSMLNNSSGSTSNSNNLDILLCEEATLIFRSVINQLKLLNVKYEYIEPNDITSIENNSVNNGRNENSIEDNSDCESTFSGNNKEQYFFEMFKLFKMRIIVVLKESNSKVSYKPTIFYLIFFLFFFLLFL